MNLWRHYYSFFAFFLVLLPVSAQTVIRLDASAKRQDKGEVVYNNPLDALAAVPEHGTTILHVAPGVYWLDNPDDPDVRTSPSGIPFAITIRTDSLIIRGMSGKPDNTIFAVNRGQTQGAIGNYTMIHFIGKYVEAEGVTFGNYCNVDLVYPDKPELDRKARAKAIVQAQLAICERTETVRMKNCRFISRLNLCPFVGARRAFFNDCHFECTDDALNGAAFYNHCTFDFYSSRPFYATATTGAIFYDCDIRTRLSDRQFLTKAGGPLTMINTRWYAPSDSLKIMWSNDDKPYYVCYASGNALNGKPLEIDAKRPWRTVSCSEPMHKYLIPEPAITNHYPPLGMELPVYYRIVEWGQPVKEAERHFETNYFRVNPSFRPISDTIQIDHDGMRGIAEVNIDGQVYWAPSFLVSPKLKRKKNMLRVTYKLADDPAPKNKDTNVDNSLITWYKVKSDGKIIPVRQGRAGEVPDIDCMEVYDDEAFVSVMPKYLDTETGHYYEARAYLETPQKRNMKRTLSVDTDFKDVPCVVADDRTLTDCWLMDCFKPADTGAHQWKVDNSAPAWRYGTAPDGARGEGLVTALRGARLWYTPEETVEDNVRLELWADPCKTAGQGFGSATAQYFDVGIAFNLTTLSGYVLRIERTPQFDRAVTFTIYKYDHGQTTPVTKSVPSSCFKTGFHLVITRKDGVLHVKADRETAGMSDGNGQTPSSSEMSENGIYSAVELSVEAPASGNSVYMQHTGTTGASALMLHRLRLYRL